MVCHVMRGDLSRDFFEVNVNNLNTFMVMTSTYQPDVPMEEFQVQVLCSVHLYQKELMRLNCVMPFEMI